MKKKILNIFVYVLKGGITALILWMIFRKMNLSMLLESFANLPWGLVALLFFLSILRHWGQYLTWKYSLELNPLYKPKPRDLFNSYLIGQALRFAIPGGIGMMGKAAYVKNSSMVASVVSYHFERIFVVWALFTFGSMAAYHYFTEISLWISLPILIVIGTLPIWFYFVMNLNRRWRRLKPQYLYLAPGIVLIQVVITLINHYQYWLVLNGAIPIGFGEVLKRMSLSHMAYGIPITFAGLGLKESFAIHFLSEVGYTQIQVITATLSVFFLQDFLGAFVGLIIFLREKRVHWFTWKRSK